MICGKEHPPVIWPSLAILFVMLTVSMSAWPLSRSVPSEVERYTRIRDSVILERDWRRGDVHGFMLDIEGSITAGLKSLVGDVRGVNSDTTRSSLDKTIEINKLLGRHLNSGHYFDANPTVAIPLPAFMFRSTNVYPSFFGNANLGGSMSSFVPDGSLNPVLQMYLKYEKKIGPSLVVVPDSHWKGTVQMYQMVRQDFFAVRDASSIASGDSNLLGTKVLGEKRESYNLDATLRFRDQKSTALIGLQELELAHGAAARMAYGRDPLLRAALGRIGSDVLEWECMGGVQYRSRYSLGEGLFASALVKRPNGIISLLTLIDSLFLTASPMIEWKWFKMAYSIKMPLRNGHDGIWMPNVHSLEIRFVF